MFNIRDSCIWMTAPQSNRDFGFFNPNEAIRETREEKQSAVMLDCFMAINVVAYHNHFS